MPKISKRLHYFQHVPFEGLGVIGDWAQARSYSVTKTSLFEEAKPPLPDEVDFLIVMGGPMGTADEGKYPRLVDEKRYIEKFIRTGKPVLGICLGAQLIAEVLGARVYKNKFKEIGWFRVSSKDTGLFPEEFRAFHWHGDTFDIPAGARHIAQSHACKNQAFIYDNRVLALQFHLEVRKSGIEALMRECAADMTPGEFVQSPEEIRSFGRNIEKVNSLAWEVLRRLVPSAAR